MLELSVVVPIGLSTSIDLLNSIGRPYISTMWLL
jgi:hypothetical protein